MAKSLQEKYAPNNACWGCGPANTEGLHIRSFPKNGEVVAEWKPEKKYEAFDGVLNGGVIGTLLGCRISAPALHTCIGQRFAYRAEARFPMCSTFKFLAAAAVLKRVDEKRDQLDRFVSYDAKDILEYAPVTKAHLKEGGMTLGALCEAAIEQSDNTAGNLLLDTLGGPAGVTNFVRSLGDRSEEH